MTICPPHTQVPDGIYCEGMVSLEGHPFPDFSKDRLFTFSLEMRDSRVKDFTWADVSDIF